MARMPVLGRRHRVDRRISTPLARSAREPRRSVAPQPDAIAAQPRLGDRAVRLGRPKATLPHTVFRLVRWVWAVLRYYLGALGDLLRRRNTIARRATRLRHIFERLGPTFVKLGQQLSVRSDLLPYEFCRELALMLDQAPPFATRRALEIIEESTGSPIAQTFSEFQTEPIGSASLSCVYKARLRTDEWVAVKVRRPGVIPVLAADIRALGWLLQLAEWLSVFKAGFTRNLRSELGAMLFEEIDFVREARNAEIFRAEAIRYAQHHISAPRVYFALSSDEVLVTEFVTGVFLNEIMHALDNEDTAALDEIRAGGIDIAEVARNLVMAAHWELLESILFHADPHPANICIQPGNALMFVDFGSCGRLTGRYKRIWQRFYQALSRQDVQDMVSCAVAILEPLPRLDVNEFSREIELMFWDWIYAMNSEHSAWWEKASGLLWMRFAGIARRYQAYMSSEIVRIFRATFMYDTTIFRLSVSLDMRDEFRRYHRKAGKRARKRIRQAFWRRVEHGLQHEDYLEIANIWSIGQRILGRVQNYLDTPSLNFAREIGKIAYSVSMLLRVAAAALGTYLAAVAGVRIYERATGEAVRASGLLGTVTSAGLFEIAASGVLFILLRKMIVKLQEQDST
jgi:predicted unusual protein kinase regulating ubiquinone biosynthesis (AarF/ABC1/UbiB family)